MSAPYPFGETVRIVRTGTSPGRDPRGQPLPGVDESFDLHGCVVTPRAETPAVGGAQQQDRDAALCRPPVANHGRRGHPWGPV